MAPEAFPAPMHTIRENAVRSYSRVPHPEAVVPDPDGTPDRRLGVRGIQPREEQLPEHRSGVFVGAIDTDLHVFPGSFVMVRFA